MSIFHTGANVASNSFRNPMNPVNMTGGNWRVSPYYLTPSYTAGYRPEYSGPEGFNSNDNNDPSMARAAWNLTPFGYNAPYYSNVSTYTDPSVTSLVQRPVDHAASFGQRFAAPAVSLMIATNLARIKMRTHNEAYRSAARGWAGFRGRSASEIAAAGSEQSLFMGLGDRLGRGAVNGVFAGARRFSKFGLLGDSTLATGARGVMADAAGLAGGLTASVAAPLALAYAGTKVADSLIFDPYIASRRADKSIQRDFSGVYMGAYGRPVTGLGFSHTGSTRAAAQVTRSGINDFTFNESDYGAITDFASRSGLFNDLSNPADIKSRVKQVAEEVKLVMSVANEPSVKGAVKMLANLKSAGASDQYGIAGRSLLQIGQAANTAGISVQKMMNTVGQQGQYMYQSNGLVPYLGQIAGANSMASFQSAFRNGLISPSLMAMMGGTEGAAQSAMSGNLAASQTPFNMMSMYNTYLGSGKKNGVIPNIGAFSEALSHNPLEAMGKLEMNKGMLASKQLRDQGPLADIKQAESIADTYGDSYAKDKNGKYRSGVLYSVMTNQMGLTADQARAALVQAKTSASDKNYKYSLGAIQSFSTQQEEAQINQEGSWNPLWMGAKRLGHKAIEGVYNHTVAPVTEGLGKVEDTLSKEVHHYLYGAGPPTRLATTKNQALHGGKGPTHDEYDMSKVSLSKEFHRALMKGPVKETIDLFEGNHGEGYKIAGKINDILSGKTKVSSSVKKQVENIVSAKTPKEVSNALATLSIIPGGNKALGESAADLSENSEVTKALANRAHHQVSDQQGKVMDLDKLTSKALKVVSKASDVSVSKDFLAGSKKRGGTRAYEETWKGQHDVNALRKYAPEGTDKEFASAAKSIVSRYAEIPKESRGRIALAATDAALQVGEHMTTKGFKKFLDSDEGKRAKKLIALATGVDPKEFDNPVKLEKAAKRIMSSSNSGRISRLGSVTRGLSVDQLLHGGQSVNDQIAQNIASAGQRGLSSNATTRQYTSDSNASFHRYALNMENATKGEDQKTSQHKTGKAINYDDMIQELGSSTTDLKDSSNALATSSSALDSSVGNLRKAVDQATMLIYQASGKLRRPNGH